MASVDAVFAALEQKWGKLDFLVHAIGFSDKDELTGRYVDTSHGNFLRTMDISVYSFTAVAQRAEKLMTDGGSMLTMTYYGAEKVMPQLQRHGRCQGCARGEREVPRRRPRPEEDPRQCDLGRADQDACRLRHRRLPLHI